MLFLVLVADFFVLVFNRFLFFRFSLVSVFSIFFVLVLVFVNEYHTGRKRDKLHTSAFTISYSSLSKSTEVMRVKHW